MSGRCYVIELGQGPPVPRWRCTLIVDGEKIGSALADTAESALAFCEGVAERVIARRRTESKP